MSLQAESYSTLGWPETFSKAEAGFQLLFNPPNPNIPGAGITDLSHHAWPTGLASKHLILMTSHLSSNLWLVVTMWTLSFR